MPTVDELAPPTAEQERILRLLPDGLLEFVRRALTTDDIIAGFLIGPSGSGKGTLGEDLHAAYPDRITDVFGVWDRDGFRPYSLVREGKGINFELADWMTRPRSIYQLNEQYCHDRDWDRLREQLAIRRGGVEMEVADGRMRPALATPLIQTIAPEPPAWVREDEGVHLFDLGGSPFYYADDALMFNGQRMVDALRAARMDERNSSGS